MPTARATPQVEPPATGGKAFDTSGTARRHFGIDVLVSFALCHRVNHREFEGDHAGTR